MNALHPYMHANSLLNAVFFDGRFAGQPVYLSLDNEMRVELARALQCDAVDVESTICNCAKRYLSSGPDPYSRLVLDTKAWRRGGMKEPPPFTAMLFCLAHAATIMAADGEFAANNYYMRLSQLTGLPRDVLSTRRIATETFWNGLADWLLQNNHALGRPTARATNAWRYVGKAMSQAVVRASDRVVFHNLFERYGFSGSEAITPRDMEHYVSNWMDTAGPSQRLKRIWRDPELHERVAEAAIAELQNWGSRDGRTTGSGANVRPLRLSLLANLVAGFPRPSLELHLARVGEASQQGPFSLRSAASVFYLSNDVIGGISTLSPNPFGEGLKGLANTVHLDGPANGKMPSLEWEPRLIIPFAINAVANTWLEVPRVTFATPHLLLVRNANNLPAVVERYFAVACTQLPRKAADNLAGLPAGWVLYQNVQVRQLVTPEKKELECLVPFDDDGVLSLQGGLQLLPGFYHAKMPPRATFVSGKGPTNIEARTIDDDDGPRISATSGQADCELSLQELSGAQGVSVRAWRADEKAIEKELFFRDARNPHPLHRDGKGRLGYTSVLSAGQQSGGAHIFAEGFSVFGNVDTVDFDSFETSGVLLQGEPEDLQQARLSAPLVAQAARQTCIERGHHITVFPMIPPNTPAGKEVEGVCADCKRREISIYRRRVDATTPRHPRIELPDVFFNKTMTDSAIDADVLLDALSFLGHGSWAKFQALVGAWGEGAKKPRQLAHELFLLGFLDVELQPGSNAIKSWCVPPPSLVFTNSGKAFLSGFRSPTLVEDAKIAIEQAGGVLDLETKGGLPARAWARGLSPREATSALDDVRDALGRRIAVVADAAVQLAAALLEMDGIDAFLQPISIGRARNLQRFDFSSVRWKDVPALLGAGAYRWNDGLQVYAHVDSALRARAAPYQVAKLLAARDASVQLHRHDANRGVFLSTLGCEPPGLLERVLVACSGELPMIGRGTSIYKDVTQNVAAPILTILYQAGEEHETRKSHQRH
jgi:hypothetical protein